MSVKDFATYDIDKSYYWNFENGPVYKGEFPKNLKKKPVRIWDRVLDFPIFIPAGLLLNGNWVLFYERMGFSGLVYKTVRTKEHPAHPMPNCLFVKTDIFDPYNIPDFVHAPYNYEPDSVEEITITNSFGMPSREPNWWQMDIDNIKDKLSENTLLIVSGVGTSNASSDLLSDFLRVASMIAELERVDAVELNFSCPNVKGEESMIYTDPDISGDIARRVRKVIKGKPLIIKIGLLLGENLKRFVKAVGPFVEAISGINSVSLRVLRPDGLPALGPERSKSGVCGFALIECTKVFVRELVKLRKEFKMDWYILATGGVTNSDGFKVLMEEGADLVGSCVGAMFDPLLAVKIRGVEDESGDNRV
ncbi:MAG: hypothetical protein ACPLSJ_01885 [Thermosulfidibacteraceae bacterium]|jgi:dihydroorotate dehydrogenase